MMVDEKKTETLDQTSQTIISNLAEQPTISEYPFYWAFYKISHIYAYCIHTLSSPTCIQGSSILCADESEGCQLLRAIANLCRIGP